ncbi:MAG: ribonuclease P protein subunit [Candidatus Micrarchaeia archaeon]|jgi:ribonuclease P protein subunit POP4
MKDIQKIIMMSPLIGFKTKIIKSNSKEMIKLAGKIIDETKNTIKMELGDREIVVAKKSNTFLIFAGKTRIEIDGEKIMFRPEEKAKNKIAG